MKTTPRVILVLAALLLCLAAAIPTSSVIASNVFASPVATPGATVMPTAAPPGTILGTHIVRSGESLYCIGRAYSVSPWAIASTNSIVWPYTIYVSQTLKIPNVTWFNIPPGVVCVQQFSGTVSAPTPVPGTPVPTVTPAVCALSYTIQPGDTLLRIAQRYSVDIYGLASRNHIANLNLIFAYTSLCIQ